MNNYFHDSNLELNFNIKIYLNVANVNLIFPMKVPPPLALSCILLLNFRGNSLILKLFFFANNKRNKSIVKSLGADVSILFLKKLLNILGCALISLILTLKKKLTIDDIPFVKKILKVDLFVLLPLIIIFCSLSFN